MKPCPHCHVPNRPASSFCMSCGKSMTISSPPTQPPTELLSSQLSSLGKTVVGVPTAGSSTLVVNWPGGGKDEHALAIGSTHVGRAANNEIVLNFPTVSSRHLRLDVSANQVQVSDLGSTNGSQLNGRDIPAHIAYTLLPGDVLRVGDLQGNSLSMSLQPTAGVSTSIRPLGMQQLAQDRQILIGRDPANQVHLHHPSVSRQHAEIQRQNGQMMIRDLHSANGTFINGQRISGWNRLEANTIIQIGPFKLAYDGQQQGLSAFLTRGHTLDAIDLHMAVGKGLLILNNISLSVQPGEFIALVGGSGAGKSTLLRAMNGYQPATAGQMLIDGQDLYDKLPAYRMLMSYVPQDDIIHKELPVRKALWYAAKLRLPDATNQEIEARINDVLHMVQLTRHADKPVHVLSGGQRKRVSIAVELLADPDLLFLDEPSTGLDPGLEKKLMYDFNRLADQGKTVILVTHATDNIEQCDQVAFLVQGRLAFYGPPREAISFFNTNDFADIYLKLEREIDPLNGPQEAILQPYYEQQSEQTREKGMREGVLWSEHYRQSPLYQQYVTTRQQQTSSSQAQSSQSAPPQPKNHSRDSLWRQTWLLARRNLDLIRYDKRSLFILLLMMPLIAILFVFVTEVDYLTGKQLAEIAIDAELIAELKGAEVGAKKDHIPVLLAMLVLNFFGLALTQGGTFGAAYEIVKERAIFARERAVNLRVGAYVLSKALVLAGFALFQVVATLLIFGIKVSLDVEPVFPFLLHGSLELGITLFIAMLASIMFGLFISAIIPSPDVVLYLILVQLFVQVVLGGTLFPLPENAISKSVISYWTLNGLATTVDIRELNKESRICTIEDVDFEPLCRSADVNERELGLYYERSQEDLLWTWGMLLLQAAFWCGLTIVVQSRKKT